MQQKKETNVIWRDDMIFTGYNNGYSIPLDVPPANGGHNAGSGPLSLLLTALAGCTAMDVISILRKKKQSVTGLEVQVSGLLGEKHPKVWTEIDIKYIITGHSLDPKAIDRAIELSRDKYCGVAATLRHTATIHYSHDIIQTED